MRQRRRRRTQTRKPRQQYVYVGSPEKFDPREITVTNSSFILPDDGRAYYVFHQREYRRPRKPKVIYALFRFFGSGEIRKDPMDELRRYDRVFAVDTNYPANRPDAPATTSMFEGSWGSGRASLSILQIATMQFVPTTAKPEREGWRAFLEQAVAGTGAAEDRCCLFVDSDLGALSMINSRDEAVVDDFLLPEQWQLNYATSDTNDDFPGVRLMRACENSNQRYRPRRGA